MFLFKWIIWLPVLLLFILQGCWDRIEVEDRILVLGMAIDTVPDEQEEGERKYSVTIQVIEPSTLVGGVATQASKEPIWNVTTTSESVREALKQFQTRIYRIPYYEHLKVIVIGEDLAREGIEEALIPLLRHSEIRLKTKVMIAEGRGRNVLQIKPMLEPVSAIYISRLSEEARFSARFPDIDLGMLSHMFHAKSNMLIPRVRAAHREAKLAGGAIMKKGKWIGWMGEAEVAFHHWVVGEIRGGEIVVECPEGDEGHIAYEVDIAKSIIKPMVNSENISFRIKVETEGVLMENTCKNLETLDAKSIEKMEALLRDHLKQGITRTIKKVQTEYKTDIFEFAETLSKREPKVWKKVEKRWIDLFPTVPVEVDVKVLIRRVGATT
ncbi:Ger(x)C family spore germination protein [Microaerobacter geothermalis]|uniref:Ger(x)C family spore germination protein n=1 Tax=Microaerobacter geothermalis TaxID=674972 RepID=UPI001F47E517|nr:Ger(x)C family spore germination protein [Microaerobacter geothermalis]MCF6094468.1 Ger(x)C family spore germination protein [Microaerobacter geothermalis]